MHADRIAAWIPLAIAGGAVTALALFVVRPALTETEQLEREAATFEAVASRETAAVRGAERARGEVQRLDERRLAWNEQGTSAAFRKTGTFAEIARLLAAIDSAPRSKVRRVELLAEDHGRVALTAEVDAELASRITSAEDESP